MKRLASLALFTAFVARNGNSQDWPQFRGPHASGVAGGHPTPARWNGETGEHILWKASIPGLSMASPIVWGDRVFVVTAVSSTKNETLRHGLCRDVEPHSDRNSGKVVW